MFTGIVEELGRVRSVEDRGAGTRLVVACATVVEDTAVGDSVAVNGVCLTAVEVADGALAFDVTPETAARSTLGRLRPDDAVNLERPVTLATRLGGHLVQGHVDGVGTVERVEQEDAGASMRIAVPNGAGRYLVEKGSVTVDGVSLTVAGTDGDAFDVALIPHTLAVTTLGERRAGDEVNLETDVLARYVERLTGRER